MKEPLAVDEERWQEAQRWELAFWSGRQHGWKRYVFRIVGPLYRLLRPERAAGDDDNVWWQEVFDAYAFLPKDVGDYIELGCGPYTNTRLVLKGREAQRVVCSDPLAAAYVQFPDRWLSKAAAAGEVEIDTHPIEDCPYPPGSFDVVVLINVLDHVRDAALCLETAIGLLRPGGYFIFGQDLADPASAGRPEYAWYEQGHPLRVTEADVRPFLERFGASLVDKVLPPRDPRLQTGVLAFAGRVPSRGDG